MTIPRPPTSSLRAFTAALFAAAIVSTPASAQDDAIVAPAPPDEPARLPISLCITHPAVISVPLPVFEPDDDINCLGGSGQAQP